MATSTPSTRRDRRYALPPGSATIEFTDPRRPALRVEVPLTRISAAGLELKIGERDTPLSNGTVLDSVTLRIDGRALQGQALVRSSYATDSGAALVGCLFYPGTSAIEERLVAVLADLHRRSPEPTGPRT